MGAQGSTTVDFGAFPGVSDASVAITGQASILAGSLVEAWLVPADTADHLADEHLVEPLVVLAGNIVAGTGFTIYCRSDNRLAEPVETVPGENSIVSASATTINVKTAAPGKRDHIGGGNLGGTVPRVYGKWTVGWVWN